MDLCTKCGNTGKLVDGQLCTCKYAKGKLEETTLNASVTFIPKDYIGITFDSSFVQPTEDGYADYMQRLYSLICTNFDIDKNLFISSPKGRGKQVFAYSAIQYLAKRGIPVFPYIDTGEVGRYIRDIDHGKIPPFLTEHTILPDGLYSCPILFVKANMAPANETLLSLVTLLDRRTRQGRHTIVFSQQKWQGFTTNDIYQSLRSIQGDGLFGTIEVKEWGYIEKIK